MRDFFYSNSLSITAILLAALSIVWNIYKDILMKPRLKGRIQISDVYHGGETIGPFIDIIFVNHGPGSITIESVQVRKISFLRLLRRKVTSALVVHDYTNPYSATLPKELKVGEKLRLFFKYESNSLLACEPTHVGVADSFGRTHWVNSKSLKKSTSEYLQKYSKVEFGQI